MKKLSKIEMSTLKVFILIASVISFTTTYRGMRSIIDVNSFSEEVLIFALVFLIQGSLVLFLAYFSFAKLFNRVTFGKALISIVLYFVVLTISVLFSFAFYYKMFSSESFSKKNLEVQTNGISETLLGAKESLEDVFKTVQELSNYSAKMAKKEQEVGGTCGGRALVNYGDLTQIRLDDEALTSDIANKIEDISKNLNIDIKHLQEKVVAFQESQDIPIKDFEKNINEEVKSLNRQYLNDKVYVYIQEMLLSRSGVNRYKLQGFNIKKKATYERNCVDKGYSRKVDAVIHKLNNIRPLLPIAFFDSEDNKAILTRAGTVLKAVFTHQKILPIEEMKDKNDVTTEDTQSMVLGFLIDMIIFALSILDKSERERQNQLQLNRVKHILNGQESNSSYRTLQPFLAEGFFSYFVALPHSEDLKNERSIIQYMTLRGWANLYVIKAKKETLKKHFREEFVSAYEKSPFFSIYIVRKRHLREFLIEDIMAKETV